MCGVEMWKAEINLCCLDIISGLTIFFLVKRNESCLTNTVNFIDHVISEAC